MTDHTQQYFQDLAQNLYTDAPATESFASFKANLKDLTTSLNVFKGLGEQLRAAFKLRPKVIDFNAVSRLVSKGRLQYIDVVDVNFLLPYGIGLSVIDTIQNKQVPAVQTVIDVTSKLRQLSSQLNEICNRTDRGLVPRPVFDTASVKLYEDVIARDKKYYSGNQEVPSTLGDNFASLSEFVDASAEINTLNADIDRRARPADIERLTYRIDSLVKSLADKSKRGDLRDETKAIVIQDIEVAAAWIQWIGITLNTQAMLTVSVDYTAKDLVKHAK